MLPTIVIKSLILPPAIQIMALLLGFVMWKRRRLIAVLCLFFAIVSLWLLSTPIASAWLHQPLESQFEAYTADVMPEGVGAIVVLGAGRHYNAPEYGEDDTLSHSALWRLRYAAYLSKRWDLPVLVSGGAVNPRDSRSEADIAARFLVNELSVPVVWQEQQSQNTWENARYSQRILQDKGVRLVVLVTHAYHMRRASYSFDQADVQHIPMPTGFVYQKVDYTWWGSYIPSVSQLHHSSQALHEYLGWWFYQLK